MKGLKVLKSALVGGASMLTLAHPAIAKEFNIPDGDLSAALVAYMKQSDLEVVYADDAVRGHKSLGAKGDYTEVAALTQILRGTGFAAQSMNSSNAVEILPQPAPERVAQVEKKAAPPSAASSVETVVVTAQHKAEDIQQVPIAITALSQQQLTERQVAGGPDLVKEVPNLTFSKTNFTGYNLEIRGIGTQAISVTTDPAVAVAFNDTPFIRNHFFEQEFYDLQDVEVLRGPQGTLYGRNATAGVVNLKSALPTDQYEAMLSADIGNYSNRRLEAMLNIPIVGDKLDIRFAGEWTKRDGYSFDTITNQPIDGRDLWSGRMTIGWKPTSDVQTYLVWEHFQEDDDRLRSGKQLCKTDTPPTSVNGAPVIPGGLSTGAALTLDADYLSQGCSPTSLYAPDAFQVPYGFSLPYAVAYGSTSIGGGTGGNPGLNPYAGATQSTNLRDIESTIDPHYLAKNDTLEFNATWTISPALTFNSQTGYNHDFLWSSEDYNRFATSPGIFQYDYGSCGGNCTYGGRIFPDPAAGTGGVPSDSVLFCDPQLGCSDRLVGEDLSEEHAWQLSQEFRLASNFSGPFNFSIGGNYLHYETEENYYVFINALSIYSVYDGHNEANNNVLITPGNIGCLTSGNTRFAGGGFQNLNPKAGGGEPTQQNCVYYDPNPIGSLDNEGHNYFLSQNPYTLNSYAVFGEAYYDIAPDLKFTGGLRWTIDQKHFIDIPSEVIAQGYGYPITGVVNQQWREPTGRAALNWMPQLDFTDQTLIYGSVSHGYKAGGANPPGAILLQIGGSDVTEPDHPLTFKPEFINAFELGTKNTLLDGSLTLNGDVFYYDYKDYQISEIVDRTSINQNFNAHVEGAEIESTYEPAPGLRFNFAGGWEDTRIDNGQGAIDLMDRTAGMPGWMVVKPNVTQASNCILPTYVVQAILEEVQLTPQGIVGGQGGFNSCGNAYNLHLDPATNRPYAAYPTGGMFPDAGTIPPAGIPIPAGYPGFDPLTAPNNGEGFSKNLGGNKLPNAPPFTVSFGASYTLPITADWTATLRGDYYWQDYSWARVFNDNPYDRIRGYTNVNLALILTSANGWQVMGYVKNVFNVTTITGDFLNSDDSGLTTNVFLTDPRLIGVRVTKQLDENDGFWGSSYNGADFFTSLFSDTDNGKPPLWIELGGQAEHISGQGAAFSPGVLAANPTSSVIWEGTTPTEAQRPPLFDFGEEARISFQPEESSWVFSASARIGRSSNLLHVHHQTYNGFFTSYASGKHHGGERFIDKFSDTEVAHKETHAVMDFSAGKDVGLGMFGLDGESVVSGGLRIAQFTSRATFDMRARPEIDFKDFNIPPYFLQLPYFHTYHATGQASHKFRGIGPSLSWNGSVPVVGEQQNGELTVDWGANGALLFGRQKTRVRHQESSHFVTPYYVFVGGLHTGYQHGAAGHNTDRSVVVPNLGGFAGISWRYNNAKVSFGYRADFFFGAIDGGIDKRHSETLNMGGPFATISFGLGG